MERKYRSGGPARTGALPFREENQNGRKGQDDEGKKKEQVVVTYKEVLHSEAKKPAHLIALLPGVRRGKSIANVEEIVRLFKTEDHGHLHLFDRKITEHLMTNAERNEARCRGMGRAQKQE